MTATSLQTADPIQGLQLIPLAAISPNPHNPRKKCDQVALKELAESIKVHGVRQPVLLRPKGAPGHFQLVCGERRCQASKLAGKTDIPAIVDPSLTDRQALEIGILENLQREDVHPLEEALGYDMLLKMPTPKGEKETVETIAAKVGKSTGYIYARCKLLALIPAGREAFATGRITAGHAVLIARLQPRDQVNAIAGCFSIYGEVRQLKNHDPEKLKFEMICDDPEAGLIPEKALREWIQGNVNLKLKDVPWDLNDAQLVPIAGACSSCPKRSTSNPALFSELTIKGEDTCFDAECFKSKREAFVQVQLDVEKMKQRQIAKGGPAPGEDEIEVLRQLSEQAGYTPPKPDQKVLKQGQWLAAKQGECPSVETGLIVRGENAGTRRLVCCNGSCKVHKHHLSGSPARGQQIDYDLERYKKFKKTVVGKKRAAARAQLVRQMVEHVRAKIPVELLREVVAELIRPQSDDPKLLWLLGLDPKAAEAANCKKIIAKAKGVQLNQLVVGALLLDSLNEYADDVKTRGLLLGFSKALGMKTARAILEAQDARISKEQACRGCGCTEETPCDWWANGKRVRCSWAEEDLCSNPDCKKYAPSAKAQTSAAKKPKAEKSS